MAIDEGPKGHYDNQGIFRARRTPLDPEPKTMLRASSVQESDPVHHPPHYKAHPSGVECIQITEWFNFNLGNAIKYIWRADEKGKQIEDLKKAVWYTNREIERLENLPTAE